MLDAILTLGALPVAYLVVLAAAALDGLFPPVPSESVVIALAALAVSTGRPSLVLLILAAAAGAVAGDQLAYTVGRRFDVRGLRVLRGERSQRTIGWAQTALDRRGPSFILAARYVPVGRVAVSLTAGATGYSRRRFTALTALAGLAWASSSVAIGMAAGAWFADRPVVAMTLGVIGGLLGGLAVDRFLTHRHERRRGLAQPIPLPHEVSTPGGTKDALAA